MRFIKETQPGSTTSSSHSIIYEYKVGVLTLEHLIDTIYLKDYINCVANGTNMKIRNKKTPLRNLYTNAKCRLLRLPKIDNITLVMLGDRISTQAHLYAEKINKSGKYVHRVSSGYNIPVTVYLRTYKDYIYTLASKRGIQWNHINNLNQEINNMSAIIKPGEFPKWDQKGTLIGHWDEDRELLSF